MKRELKRKYLVDNYREENFLKIYYFKQKNVSVEEYTTKFDNLRRACGTRGANHYKILKRFEA